MPEKTAIPLPKAGESWRSYLRRLADMPASAPQMAGIIAATTLMRRSPDTPVNPEMLETLASRIVRRPELRELSRDPKAIVLAKQGKGGELINELSAKRELIRQRTERYRRPEGLMREDAAFLKLAISSIKDESTRRGAAMKERESLRLQEMIKRMEHAQSLLEQGIPLSGKVTRELVGAVRRYNDGGTAIPGGKKPAAMSKQAMCVLKRFSPQQEFENYCGEINRHRGAERASHPLHVDPAGYDRGVLTGSTRTASELLRDSQRQLLRGLTVDGCAAATAIRLLSNGNPNAVIPADKLQTEMKRLKTPGSAFMKVMEDEKSRGSLSAMAAQGKIGALSRTIVHQAKLHSVRAAQWQINQAAAAVANNGKATKAQLAGVLAARELTTGSEPGTMLTNKAFRERARQIEQSDGFNALAERYEKSPSYRNYINAGLRTGSSGEKLTQEYQKMSAQKSYEQQGPTLHKEVP